MAFDLATATPLRSAEDDSANRDELVAELAKAKLPIQRAGLQDALDQLPPPRVVTSVPQPAKRGFDLSTAQPVATDRAPTKGTNEAVPTGPTPQAPASTNAPIEGVPEAPTVGQRARGAVEAALNTVAGVLGGGAGLAYGGLEAVGQNIQNKITGAPPVDIEKQALARAQQFTPGLPAAVQTPLGQQYTEDVGQKIQEHGPSLMGPAGELLGAAVGATRLARATSKGLKGIKTANDAALAQPELYGIREAHDAGFKLTPEAAKAGPVARATESMAGSAKLAKEMAPHNAENAARLVSEDFGLAPDQPLTPEAMKQVREEAGKDYAAVKDVGRFENDPQYSADLDRIADPILEAAKDYPESKLAADPLIAAVDGLRTEGPVNTASAIEMVKTLRNKADIAFRAGDKKSGGAYRALAGAVDNAMDRALTQMADQGGDPALADAVTKYRAARVRIAQSYMADDAMDGALKPGEINANIYAKALDNNVPLEGGALKVAKFAKQFGGEGLAKTKGKSGGFGPTFPDILLAALHYPKAAFMVAARPAARAVLRSDYAQERMAGSKPLRPAPPVEEGPTPWPLTSSPGAAPPDRGGTPGPVASALGDLTPDWQTTPGAAPAPAAEALPAAGLTPALGEPAVTTGRERATVTGGQQIPAVPGHPELPDVMPAGPPKEVAGTARAGAAMGEPGAIEARRQQATAANAKQAAAETPKRGEIPVADATELKVEAAVPAGEPKLDPRLAEIERLRAASDSPAVHAALDKQAKAVQADIKAKEAEVKRAADVKALEKSAAATEDPELRKTLQAEADKLRGGKLPVGETKEGQPPIAVEKPGKIPVGETKEGQPEIPVEKTGKVPAGTATEVPVENVEPAPEPIEAGESTPIDWAAFEQVLKEHKLNKDPENRSAAERVEVALAINPKAVEDAAVQTERSPAMFEKKVQEIIDSEPKPTTKRVKMDAYGSDGVGVEVTMPDGSKRVIQRLNSAETMGLPGWHDADAVGKEKGSYLEDTQQAAVDRLFKEWKAKNADETKQAAAGSKGDVANPPAGPAASGEATGRGGDEQAVPERAASPVPTPAEQPGADSPAAPRADSEKGAASGQATEGVKSSKVFKGKEVMTEQDASRLAVKAIPWKGQPGIASDSRRQKSNIVKGLVDAGLSQKTAVQVVEDALTAQVSASRGSGPMMWITPQYLRDVMRRRGFLKVEANEPSNAPTDTGTGGVQPQASQESVPEAPVAKAPRGFEKGAQKMKPSEIKASLLKQIDEAIAKASDDVPEATAPTIGKVITSGGKREFTASMVPPGSDTGLTATVLARETGDKGATAWAIYGGSTAKGKPLAFVFDRVMAQQEVTPWLRGAEWKAEGGPAGSWTFKRAGIPDEYYVKMRAGGTEYKILNTRNKLAAFRETLEKAPGFSDRSPRASVPTNPSVRAGSGNAETAIANMISEHDFQAAFDYATAKGIDPMTVKLPKYETGQFKNWLSANPQ